LVEGLMGGMAQEAWGFFPPSLPQGIDARQSLSVSDSMQERKTRAEALLDSAGLRRGRNGLRFRVHLSTSPDAGVRLRALALQEQWRRIGVEVQLLSKEFGTLFSEISAGKFEMAMLRWTGASDPEMLVRTFHSNMIPPSGFNRGRFRDAAVDRLLDESHHAETPESRLAKLREAQIRIVEAAPCVFLWWPDQLAALAPGLEIDLNGVGDFTGIWRR
jgi:peptide/nickel transport system substrate-binding protein